MPSYEVMFHGPQGSLVGTLEQSQAWLQYI
jgi:hypothetical protein